MDKYSYCWIYVSGVTIRANVLWALWAFVEESQWMDELKLFFIPFCFRLKSFCAARTRLFLIELVLTGGSFTATATENSTNHKNWPEHCVKFSPFRTFTPKTQIMNAGIEFADNNGFSFFIKNYSHHVFIIKIKK